MPTAQYQQECCSNSLMLFFIEAFFSLIQRESAKNNFSLFSVFILVRSSLEPKYFWLLLVRYWSLAPEVGYLLGGKFTISKFAVRRKNCVNSLFVFNGRCVALIIMEFRQIQELFGPTEYSVRIRLIFRPLRINLAEHCRTHSFKPLIVPTQSFPFSNE